MPSAFTLAPTKLAVALALVLAAIGSANAPARAQGKLEARYAATLAGIPIGQGTWMIDISAEQYTASASGHVGGLMRVLTSGEGSTAASGAVSRGRIVPGTFTAHMTTRHDAYDVRMTLAAGNVKELVVDPPVEPSPDRVPVGEAHRRGVSDPMSAAMIAVPGTGDVLTAEACQRKLPVFDGRQRFDVALTFKRMDRVRSERGYAGPVVVCGARYVPIAGHRPERYAIKYLREARDIEFWLAPIAGTRVVVPYRISVPTLLGTATLQATHFEVEPNGSRPTSATTNAKPAPIPRSSRPL